MWEHEKVSGSITDCWCPFLRLARNPKFQKKSKAQRPTKKTKEQERPENKKEIKAKNYVWAEREMQGKVACNGI